jgi:oligoendopeptidase F
MTKEIHPFILMNYNGKFSSVSTLAHEMGHALHSWYSNNNQPFPKAEYPIFLAEIASTFNENLLVGYMIKNETDELMKMFILDKYIEGFRTTLYRQTMFAEFELEMNSHIEKGGTLTADWLDKKYIELTREYYGQKDKILDVDEYIANEWSAIPHFYYNFYVYQYSTGIIASGILSEYILNGGREEREKYINFLKSGNSDYPINILKKAGVNLTDPNSFKTVFQSIDKLVTELEMISIPTSPNFLLS